MFLTLNQMKIHQNEKSTHAGDWLPADGCSAAGYIVSVQAIQALNQHLITVLYATSCHVNIITITFAYLSIQDRHFHPAVSPKMFQKA